MAKLNAKKPSKAEVAPGEGVENKHFTVDARTVLQLGRQSIKDHTTAMLELVKNAYDADAKTVQVDIQVKNDLIRVADNGVGMSGDLFDQTWLRIGYSAKRRAPFSPSGTRRVVGEKGVGRISADRLGSRLELRTKAANEDPFSASVIWDAFDVEGRDLTAVDVVVRGGEAPSVPPHRGKNPRVGRARSSSGVGTELLIRNLRQSWTAQDVSALMEDLASLVSPFDGEHGFEIVVTTDVEGAPHGVVQSSLPYMAEIDLTARVERGLIKFTIVDRLEPDAAPRTSHLKKRWTEVAHERLRSNGATKPPAAPRTGPFSIRLFYVPARAFTVGSGVLKLKDVRARATGVRVYRDHVRVLPYGDRSIPQGDWLGLAQRKTQEPAGISRKTYRIPPTELAGAVFISRDRNPQLQDSAGREGLIQNDAFGDLRTAALACVRELEQYRHTRHKERAKEPVETEQLEQVLREFKSLRREWRAIAVLARENPRAGAARAVASAQKASALAQRARVSLDVVIDETRMYRGLSSLGISASVFGHETQGSINLCIGELAEAADELRRRDPDIDVARKSVDSARVHAQRVSAWGAFAVARLRNEKRKRASLRVDAIIATLVGEMERAYSAARTDVDLVLVPSTIVGYAMDLEAVALNLLTNAYTFVQQSRRKRVIRIEVRPEARESGHGVLVVVADSGPGVPAGDRDVIWRPLYTTKRDRHGNEIGTGLGLAIVDSIVRDVGGSRSVEKDQRLGGAMFKVWLPREWSVRD